MGPSYLVSLFKELGDTFGNWYEIPGVFWRILWPLALIVISSYPLVACWSVIRREVRSRLDRWMLAPVFGLAWYTLLFVALNALFKIPIGQISFYIVFALTCAGGYGWLWKKQTGDGRGQGTGNEEQSQTPSPEPRVPSPEPRAPIPNP